MALSRHELQLMLGALAGFSLGNFAIFSAPIYIGSLIDGLGFNENQAGLTSTLEIGAVASTCVLLSRWLNRVSLRYLAISGVLLILVSNLVTFWLEDFLTITLTRVIAGTGAGLCLAATSALISRMADPDRIVGMMLAINTLIMIMVLSAMGYAKSLWMFNGFVGLFTLATLVLFPLLFLLPTEPFKKIQQDTSMPAETDPYLALGILGVGLLFLFCVIEGGVWAFSERSGTNLGMNDGDIGLLLALAQASGLGGAILAAIFGARIPRIYPIAVGILTMGTAGLVIYQTESQLIYGVFLCTFSFGFFIAFPYLVGACARLDADGRWAARANGVNLLGAATAPFLAANIVTASNYQTLGTMFFGLALFCLCLAVLFNRQMNRVNFDKDSELAGTQTLR
ncbi:MAG: MFS transporter [Gammaproteobacteria bacterium]|nr:MFS transporter [Gammaproteobacteria bacterium]